MVDKDFQVEPPFLGNRVGGDFDKSPTSHTTVRTVRYTAVQST